MYDLNALREAAVVLENERGFYDEYTLFQLAERQAMKLCDAAGLCDAIECDGYRFEAQYGDFRTLADKLILSDGNEQYEFYNYDFNHPAVDTSIKIFDLSGTLRTVTFLQIDVRAMTMGQLVELHAQQGALKPT